MQYKTNLSGKAWQRFHRLVKCSTCNPKLRKFNKARSNKNELRGKILEKESI